MPFGEGRPNSRAFSEKATVRLFHPVFEQVQAADVAEAFGGGVIFQEAGLADDLLFFGEDHVHIKRVLLDQRLGEDVLGLGRREAQGGLQDGLTLLGGSCVWMRGLLLTLSMMPSSRWPRSSRDGRA